MKHPLTLLLIVCTPFFLSGQNWSVGAHWIYWQEDFFPDPEAEYRTFTKEQDTLLQNRSCSQIWEKYVVNNGSSILEYGLKRYYLWQEGQKVYVFEPDSAQFFPLYDFSKNTGDTLYSYCPDAHEMISLRIDSLTFLNIGNQQLKVQWVQTAGFGSCYMQGPIYERIGSGVYLFARPGFVDPPPGGGLICFRDSLLSFPGDANCSLFVKSTEPYASEQIKIFPNPTADQLFLEAENIEKIRVFNPFGQVLKTYEGAAEISLNGLPDGVYLLEIQTPKGAFLKKLVKKN